MDSDGVRTDGPEGGLERLRAELDQIDERLLETLHDRLQCCARIARHKRAHVIPMMQPQRVAFVRNRVATFAEDHGISPEFLLAVYSLIISETCRLENLIIGAGADLEQSA